MDFLRSIYHRIREALPINRIVAIVAPIGIVAAAAINGYLAEHLPYIQDYVTPTTVDLIVGGTIVGGAVSLIKWLDNWGKYEEREELGLTNPLNRPEGIGLAIHGDDLEKVEDPDFPPEGKKRRRRATPRKK